MPHALPNLLVIGAAKCATTSLHRQLAEHPEVFMSDPKELNYFSRDDWRGRIEWYRRQFPATAPVRGESSPGYSMDPVIPGVAERIAELLPDARLIYLVGDPVERVVAHWVELRSLHHEHRSLREALADLDDPCNVYVAASRYGTQLTRYLKRFPRDRVLVVDRDELRTRRRETLRRVFELLQVDSGHAERASELVLNPASDKRRLSASGDWLLRRGALRPVPRLPGPMKRGLVRLLSRPLETPLLDPRTRDALTAALRPEAEQLRELTGRPFAGWSV